MYQLTGEHTPPQRNLSEADLATWLQVIQRHRKLATAVAGGFFLLVAFLTLITPRTYTTEVKFIAGGRGGSSSDASSGAGINQSTLPLLNALLSGSGAESAETYAELFQETPTAREAIEKLKLKIAPGELLSHVKVKPITDTAIVDVAVSWSNPTDSARIANALAHAFIDYRREMVANQAQTALDYLGTQLPQAESSVHETATALASYEAAHRIVDITAQTQSSLTQINTIEAKVATAQVDENQAAAQLASVNGQLAATPATISGGQ